MAAAGEEALALFAADKLSKLRELYRESLSTARRASLNRVGARRERNASKHYERSLALLDERLPSSPLVHQFRDEQRRFLPQRRFWPMLAE